MSKLLWLPVYVLTCGLIMGLVLAGATYWNWEIGLYAGLGGGAYGILGWALIVFGGKRKRLA